MTILRARRIKNFVPWSYVGDELDAPEREALAALEPLETPVSWEHRPWTHLLEADYCDEEVIFDTRAYLAVLPVADERQEPTQAALQEPRKPGRPKKPGKLHG